MLVTKLNKFPEHIVSRMISKPIACYNHCMLRKNKLLEIS